ncbi:MAG TPA: hypothetical protein VE891_13705 [Allosphingosinicella sp.]|nr:hypothetical protein [Allosphingosinicella sp.]
MLPERWIESAARRGVVEADVRLAFDSYRNLFASDDAVLAAGARCTWFEPLGARAVPAIVHRLKDSLARGQPLSLVRVGNGEGNAVSMLDRPVTNAAFEGFDFEFVSQNGLSVSVGEAVSLSRQVVDAIKSADIQGYRIGRFDEATVIAQCFDRGEISPVLGLIHARRLFHMQLTACSSEPTWFTNAWIHLDLLPHLETLCEAAPRILVITGRQELEEQLKARLGGKLLGLLHVPVQGYAPQSLADSHFGRFEQVRSRIRTEGLAGALVLVGAGLFGKIYCQDARNAGAVAVDLGSAFDLLAGVATRPAHREFDLAATRW